MSYFPLLRFVAKKENSMTKWHRFSPLCNRRGDQSGHPCCSYRHDCVSWSKRTRHPMPPRTESLKVSESHLHLWRLTHQQPQKKQWIQNPYMYIYVYQITIETVAYTFLHCGLAGTWIQRRTLSYILWDAHTHHYTSTEREREREREFTECLVRELRMMDLELEDWKLRLRWY
jgi:hypothetical protein